MLTMMPPAGNAQTTEVYAREFYLGEDREEGAGAGFEVIRPEGSPGFHEALTVNVSIAESGDMLPAAVKATRTITIQPGHEVGWLDATTIDDTTAERDSRVTFSLRGGSGYRVISPSTIRFTVTDNDEGAEHAQPIVSITAASSNLRKGQTGQFRITRTGPTAQAVDVRVHVFQGYGSGLLNAEDDDRERTVRLNRGQTSGTLSIATTNVGTQSEGYLYASVVPGTGYLPVAGPGASAQLTFQVTSPSVEFTRSSSTITEGQPAQFTVRRNAVNVNDLEVRIAINTGSARGFIDPAYRPPTTVTIKGGSRIAVISDIATIDDTSSERSGTITATIRSGVGYTVGTTRTSSVTIEDNEYPELTLAYTGTASPVEGANLTYRISRAGHDRRRIVIPVDASETGTMLQAGEEERRYIVMPQGRTSVTFTVRTENDTTEEDPSTVRVTMQSHRVTGYHAVGETNIETEVGDNDSTVLSIEALSATTDENSWVQFVVRRERGDGDEQALTARIRLTREGTIFTDSDAGTTKIVQLRANAMGGANIDVAEIPARSRSYTFEIRIPAGRGSYDFAVETGDDTIDAESGTVTATLLSGTGYRVGTAQATTTIEDDDPSVVSITGPATVREGGTAVYTITRDTGGQAIDLPVFYDLNPGRGWPEFTGTATVRFSANATSRTLRLTVPDDPYDLDDTTLGVFLRTASNISDQFRIKPGKDGLVVTNVTDNDTRTTTPVVSIGRAGSTFTEGGEARVRLSRTGPTSYPLEVFVRFAESSGFNQITSGLHAFTIPRGRSSWDASVLTTVSEETKNNTVTATLQPGGEPWYTRHATNQATTFTIAHDTRLNRVSVERVRDENGNLIGCTEGQECRLRLVRENGPIADELEVKVRGDYYTANWTTLVTIPAGKGEVEFTTRVAYVDTHNESLRLNVTAVAEPGRPYSVGRRVQFVISAVHPTIDITPRDDHITVDEGDTLRIHLNLNKRGHGGVDGVLVAWRTDSDSGDTNPATRGVDYAAIDRSGGIGSQNEAVWIGEPSPSATLSIDIYNDVVDDIGETFYVQLTIVAYAVRKGPVLPGANRYSKRIKVTIENDGALPKKYLAAAGREVSEHIVDVVKDRVRAVRASAGTRLRPRGRDGEDPPEFNIEGPHGGVWASASHRPFTTLDGSMTSYTLGADVGRGAWLAGIGITKSDGDGEYERVETESDLVTVHPYGAWTEGETTMWASAGYGTGSLDLVENHEGGLEASRYEGIGLEYLLAAAGGNRRYELPEANVDTGIRMYWNRLRSEEGRSQNAGVVREARATSASGSVYTDWTFRPAETLRPTLALSVEHERDGFTEEWKTRLKTGFGIEVQHRLGWARVETARRWTTNARWSWNAAVALGGETGLYATLNYARAEDEIRSDGRRPGDRREEATSSAEVGWRREGRLSPYLGWSDAEPEIGVRLKIAW